MTRGVSKLFHIMRTSAVIILYLPLLGILLLATKVVQDKPRKYDDLGLDKLHHNYVFLSSSFHSTRTTATAPPCIEIVRN